MKTYEYITNNNLEDRQNYMYSEFGGVEFLKLYRLSREQYLKGLKESSREEIIANHDTRKDLNQVLRNLKCGDYNKTKDVLNDYVKRFEVSKRLYTEYKQNWKVANNASYDNLDLYMLLADCCLESYKLSGCTKYFSCLLKIDDTLLSVSSSLTCLESEHLKEIVIKELEEFEKLKKSKGIDQ